jgi:hypothetical protein
MRLVTAAKGIAGSKQEEYLIGEPWISTLILMAPSLHRHFHLQLFPDIYSLASGCLPILRLSKADTHARQQTYSRCS